MAVPRGALWMEWGQDLVPTPQGGLVLAYDADQVRQGIIRELMTVGSLTLDDGTTVAPEFISFPSFGEGLRLLVGQNVTGDVVSQLQQKINAMVLKNPGVNSAVPPAITTTPVDHSVYISITYTLNSGVPDTVSFLVAP